MTTRDTFGRTSRRLAARGGRAPRARPPRRGPRPDAPRPDSGRGGRAPKVAPHRDHASSAAGSIGVVAPDPACRCRRCSSSRRLSSSRSGPHGGFHRRSAWPGTGWWSRARMATSCRSIPAREPRRRSSPIRRSTSARPSRETERSSCSCDPSHPGRNSSSPTQTAGILGRSSRRSTGSTGSTGRRTANRSPS